MKVLVACECSGTVKQAFRNKGHEAISCDLKNSDIDNDEYHYKGNVLDILNNGWDLIIAHPPCTFLTVAANRWLYDYRYPNRFNDREEAVKFAILFEQYADKVCIENPVGYLSTAWRKPDQIIQPYQFGHDASKPTCLWLKNLPLLKSTNTVEPSYITTKNGKRFSKWYYETSKYSGEKRSSIRSKTFDGIAEAMANQWG